METDGISFEYDVELWSHLGGEPKLSHSDHCDAALRPVAESSAAPLEAIKPVNAIALWRRFQFFHTEDVLSE
jgi:hypothetical protein